MTDWYTASGNPTQGSAGASNVLRSEYNSIATAFSKMPALTGYGGLLVGVNSSGTALQTYSYSEVLSALNAAALNTNVSFLTINGTTITASTQFSGPGTGLTGTAAGLSIGGNATTATTATTANALNPANNYQVTNFTYTGTLTGSTGIMNIGSGQIYKDASGNVGIGTSSPTQKLTVYDGSIKVGGSVQGKLLGYSASNTQIMDFGVATGTSTATDIGLYNLHASGIIGVGTNSIERMRIDSTGALLVNQTTPDTGAKLSVTGGIKGTITSGTAVAASGTAIDFTGIPSWAKRITVMLNGVSTNGASIPQIQLGAGSILTTGYNGNCASTGVSTVGTTLSSTGFYIDSSGLASAGALRQGSVVFTLLGSNIWTCQGAVGHSDLQGAAFPSGSVALSGTLDRIRLTTVNGTDLFDAGSVNILYEG